MKIMLTMVLIHLAFSLTAQMSPNSVIDNFIIDLKSDSLSELDVVDKYFSFNETVTNSDKEKIVLPILIPQLKLLKQKLNESCKELKLIKHNENLNEVKSFNLIYSQFNNVYYITCDNTIVTPILMDGNKILSISTYSKSKEGTKKFVLF